MSKPECAIERPGRLRRRRASRRSAAVLICVLVILLLVGMLSAQTVQTLLVVRRADHNRQQLRQARELLERGRLVIARQQIPDDGIINVSLDGQPASVQIIKLPSSTDAAPPMIRYSVVANYGGTKASENATWESPQ